jgi:hypothetical protein
MYLITLKLYYALGKPRTKNEYFSKCVINKHEAGNTQGKRVEILWTAPNIDITTL